MAMLLMLSHQIRRCDARVQHKQAKGKTWLVSLGLTNSHAGDFLNPHS
jgi:uncharacterized membrane protein YhhN